MSNVTSTSFPFIDPSVRPQDDLNRHVNGKWLETATIPDDLDSYGSFLQLRDKAEADVAEILQEAATAAGTQEAALDPDFGAIQRRIGTFYSAFMDADRAEELKLQPIAQLLEEIDSLSTPGALLHHSSKLQRQGVAGLLSGGAVRDAGNPERMLFHIFQDGIGLPDESYYREEPYAEIREKYQQHLTRLFEIAGYNDAESAASQVYALEERLASHHWDRVTLRDAQKRYNLMSRSEAEELMPLLAEAITGWDLSESQSAELVIGQPDVLPAFQKALQKEPLEAWKNWLRIQVLRSFAPLLHSELVTEHFEFYSKTLSGTPQQKERWKRGVALTNACLGEDVAQIYVARHYPAEARGAMDELIAALIEAYRRSISTLEWMGEETQQKALEKLDSFRPMVGFPNRWIDYSDVPVSEDAVANVIAADEAAWARDVAKIDDGPDDEEWHMTPQTVNAYYHPLENVICFPAAILQEPFFSVGRDMAQNFGGIGAVIGHEIGHGFDDQGSRYAADGSLTNWWTEQDREAFEQRTGALVAQFSSLSPSVLDDEHTVNGELTLGENIGDLGGIGIAHQAYRLWLAAKNQGVSITEVDGQDTEDDDAAEDLSGDQRFFYSWAQVWRSITRPERALTLLSVDPHAPAEFRAVQPPRNVDAFHRAFSTQDGDGMFLPEQDRVTIW